MAKVIEADIEAFEECIRSLKNGATECESIKNEIKRVTGELEACWYGKSKKAFSLEYTVLINNMTNYSDVLITMSNGLDDIKKEYVRVDEELANQITSAEG